MGSIGRIPFISACPTCKQSRIQSYSRDALERLLNAGHPVEAYCVTCDEFWQVSAQERANLATELAALPPVNTVRKRDSWRQFMRGKSEATFFECLNCKTVTLLPLDAPATGCPTCESKDGRVISAADVAREVDAGAIYKIDLSGSAPERKH